MVFELSRYCHQQGGWEGIQPFVEQVGSLYDRVLFRCFLYDPDSNSYVANAMLIMRISGGLSVFFLGGGVGLMLWRSSRANKRNQNKNSESTTNAHHPATA